MPGNVCVCEKKDLINLGSYIPWNAAMIIVLSILRYSAMNVQKAVCTLVNCCNIFVK